VHDLRDGIEQMFADAAKMGDRYHGELSYGLGVSTDNYLAREAATCTQHVTRWRAAERRALLQLALALH
jgi:hypothetical protein